MGFLERHTGRILWALVILLGVAAALAVHGLQQTLRSPMALLPSAPTDDSRGKGLEVPALRPKEQYDQIARRNIFSLPDAAGSKARPNPAEQKPVETALNVKLKGIVTSPEGFSVALIEDPAQRREDLYSVGDSIQDAQLVRIQTNMVYLKRGGREETLTLFSDQPAKGGAKAGAAPAAPARPGTAPARGAAPPGQPGSQQQVQNLMAQLRLRPHFQDGKPAGFVVGQVQKGSVFDQAGLKEGDVVVAINDEEVKTPNQLLKAYKEVSQDKELWLDVLRDGQEENVEIDLEAAFSKS